MFEKNNVTFNIPIICGGPQIGNLNIFNFSLPFQLLTKENTVFACFNDNLLLNSTDVVSCLGAAHLSKIKVCFLTIDFI